MSLINDALKKAARQRAEEQGDVIPPMPGGGGRRVSRHGAPMRTQTLVLIGAAAVALIVVSAVITGILMTSNPEAKAAVAVKPPAESPVPAPKVAAKAAVVTVSVPQQSVPTPTAAVVVVETPTPTPSPVVVVKAAEPAPVSKPVTVATKPSTEAIQAVVDAFHISGVRTAGAGSKALVDGHVYKLNDVVEKTYGLRLSQVEEDHLTFVDSDGNTFVRTF
jgi:hypothetical protein